MPRSFLLVALLSIAARSGEAFVSEISMKKSQPNRNSVVASWSFITTSLYYENPRDLKLEQSFEIDNDNDDSSVKEEEEDEDSRYDKLVESHPLDDPEPIAPTYKDPEPPRALQRLCSSDYYATITPNPYGIPQNDTAAEFEWFRKRLLIRRNARRLFDGDDSSVQVVSVHGSKTVEDALLRHWMAHQRRRFMKTLGILELTNNRSHWGTTYLTKREKKQLDAVGFSWAHLQPKSLTNEFIYSDAFQKQVRLKYKDWIWGPHFEELKQSLLQQEQNGDGTRLLPDGEDYLGRWASEQRRLRWEMPKRRRVLLDEIHFDWEVDCISVAAAESLLPVTTEKEEKPPYVPFAKRMSQLKKYRLAFGDCNVPLPPYNDSNKNEVPDGLGEWVQRMKSRRADLAPRTVLQFERLGFHFDDA